MTLFNGQQGQRCKGKAERPLLRSCDFCYTIVGELASILNHRKCNDECPLSAIPSIQTISLPLSHFTIFSFPASFLMTSSLSFSPIRTHFISTQLFRLKIPAKKLFWGSVEMLMSHWLEEMGIKFLHSGTIKCFFWGLVKDSSGQWVLIKQLWSFKFESC